MKGKQGIKRKWIRQRNGDKAIKDKGITRTEDIKRGQDKVKRKERKKYRRKVQKKKKKEKKRKKIYGKEKEENCNTKSRQVNF